MIGGPVAQMERRHRTARAAVGSERPIVAHFVSPYLFGTGSWIYSQLVHLRRYRPIVLTDQTTNLDLFPFTPIYTYENVSAPQKALLCLWKGRLRGASPAFFEWVVRRQQASLLHSHFGTYAVEMLTVKRHTGLPMITTFYGADMSQAARDPFWRGQYHFLFEEGDLFLAEGSAMRRGLVELGCPPDRIVIQRLGVDLEALPFLIRRLDPSGTVRVLIAGTFREKKGIPDALRAIQQVRRRCPNVRATLIGDSAGKPGDEDEKRIIVSLVKHLDGAVEWVGFLPYPAFRKAMLTHHLFLSPSVTAKDGDSEGGAPVSIIEAQATGMPIVSTYHADIPEVVLNGESALLSPERNVDSLADSLERLVTQPDLWEPMGKAGRAHVEQCHDVRTQAARLEDLYARFIRAR